MQAVRLALHFTRREMRNRYLGSISGALWALLQPLAQLTIYGFVWAYVFRMRLPQEYSQVSVVPFLALGMWPWNAFSEAIMRSTTTIQDNAGLIGKVALPREVLVFASAGASFALHTLGFVAILLVLGALGMPVHVAAIPLALLGMLQLFLLALGFAFLLASLQVFVRDIAQVLQQLIPLWMFLSPVLYPRDALPEAYRGWLGINPFTFYPEYFRTILLGVGQVGLVDHAVALGVAAGALAIGYLIFRRLSPRFEDFL